MEQDHVAMFEHQKELPFETEKIIGGQKKHGLLTTLR